MQGHFSYYLSAAYTNAMSYVENARRKSDSQRTALFQQASSGRSTEQKRVIAGVAARSHLIAAPPQGWRAHRRQVSQGRRDNRRRWTSGQEAASFTWLFSDCYIFLDLVFFCWLVIEWNVMWCDICWYTIWANFIHDLEIETFRTACVEQVCNMLQIIAKVYTL